MNRMIYSSAAIVSVVISTMAVSPANSQQNCDTYGELAIEQIVKATQANCPYEGPRWSTSLKDHIQWCLTVGPTEWKSELKKREDELKKCTS